MQVHDAFEFMKITVLVCNGCSVHYFILSVLLLYLLLSGRYIFGWVRVL